MKKAICVTAVLLSLMACHSESAPSAKRITESLQVLYTFEEGSGTTVKDSSGVGAPLDLHISDASAVAWIAGGIAVNRPSLIASANPATKLIEAAYSSHEITVEAWIKPASSAQDGPARIVTLSKDPHRRNFTLGQGLWGDQPSELYNVRLRTTATSGNGAPSLSTPAGLLTTALSHVVYTRDSSGAAKIYFNGVEQANFSIGGDFSNWDESTPLVLANEWTGDRPWLGEYYLVAIYSRALSLEEVRQNFMAGPAGVAP